MNGSGNFDNWRTNKDNRKKGTACCGSRQEGLCSQLVAPNGKTRGRLRRKEHCSNVFDLGKLTVGCQEGGFESLGGGQGVTVGQGEVGLLSAFFQSRVPGEFRVRLHDS